MITKDERGSPWSGEFPVVVGKTLSGVSESVGDTTNSRFVPDKLSIITRDKHVFEMNTVQEQ